MSFQSNSIAASGRVAYVIPPDMVMWYINHDFQSNSIAALPCMAYVIPYGTDYDFFQSNLIVTFRP